MTLLDEFLKKKRREVVTKAVNMQMVQEAVGIFAATEQHSASAPSGGQRRSLDAITNLHMPSRRPRKPSAKRYSVEPGQCTSGGAKKGDSARVAEFILKVQGGRLADIFQTDSGDGREAKTADSISRESCGGTGPAACVPATGFNIASDGIINKGEVVSDGPASRAAEARIEVVRDSRAQESRPSIMCSPTIEERRLRIENHATKMIDIPYSLINATRLLPAGLKRISQLFKILDTTHRFNQRRELSLVLIKYKDSIEQLFKHRLEGAYLEQLNFIAGDHIEFIPVAVLENGKKVSSVTIKIAEGVDIDGLLFGYFISEYGRWANERGVEGPMRTIHPEFDAEGVELPRKPIPGMDGGASKVQDEPPCAPLEVDKMKARQAAGSIYERIKEKERLRREAFRNEQTIVEDYGGKIDSLFVVGARRAIKLSDLIFQLGSSFGCREKILGSLGDKYYLRKFDGVEYVVKASR